MIYNLFKHKQTLQQIYSTNKLIGSEVHMKLSTKLYIGWSDVRYICRRNAIAIL